MTECKRLQDKLDLQGMLNGFCEQDGSMECFRFYLRNFKTSKLSETDTGGISSKLETAKWFIKFCITFIVNNLFFRNGLAEMEMEAVLSRFSRIVLLLQRTKRFCLFFSS